MKIAAIVFLLLPAAAPYSPPSGGAAFSEYRCQPCQPDLLQSGPPGLVVRAGESWIFTVKDGLPADARPAARNDKPAKGEIFVTLEFEGGASVMAVTSNDEVWWNYRAFIVSKPGHKGNRTSVCTLMNGERTAIERWPGPVPAIRLADFSFASDRQLRCE
ncbi:hypothetical protein [Sphingomonas sp. G-3-2-10]|uniref:hypothetical protein n=1 Tax=Sphingomonas sp. G-3-2-10 TaxID=2728838 RepID=UPI00146E1471|nr:hypothetical protein [Sphingomonas sp. G-3-2-10]NML07739.1 hypothetical protein [Sphingomonas sp. G-3-2-10]